MTIEEGYLGAVLLHGERYYEHNVKADDFTQPRCRMVWEAIGRTLDAGGRVDPALIVHDAGVDPVWFASLTTDPPFDVRRSAERVIANGRHHRIRLLVKEAAERVDREDADSVLEFLDAGLAEVTEGRDDDVVDLASEVGPMVVEFERRFRDKGQIPGITSGLADLDDLLLGFQPRCLYLVGARPSQGKSALLLNFAMAAVEAGHKPGYMSIESSRRELLQRAFANVGGIKLRNLQTGMYGANEAIGITKAAEYIKGKSILVADKPNMELADLKARARRMVRTKGCDILFVDYVQLIDLPGGLTDYERVSKVSVALKQLARELEVPLVTAAQLNRGSEEGKTRKPRLSDLKNTGQLEQDADAVVLIYHRGEGDDVHSYLCVEKNRDGATADIEVAWDGSKMRFRNHI